MTKLYLAHPFDSRRYIRDWELRIEKASKGLITLLNPFYDNHRKDVIAIDLGRSERYERLIPEEIINKDVQLISKGEGVIAIIDGNTSYGTIQEMVYAKFLDKPVYSVINNGHHNHPWLVFHSALIFKSLDKLERFLLNGLKNKNGSKRK